MAEAGLDPITLFADGPTLVYHEARNVRHLIKKGHVPSAEWQTLVSSLSADPVEAWRQLQPVRGAARVRPSAEEAAEVLRDGSVRVLMSWRHCSKIRIGNTRRLTVAMHGVLSLPSSRISGPPSTKLTQFGYARLAPNC